MKIWFQNRRMKWRNCKEKEVHHTRSPMDELMAQGLAPQEEEQEEEEQKHQKVAWSGAGVEEEPTTNTKAKRSATLQKSCKDS